jgi:hypothetical protein
VCIKRSEWDSISFSKLTMKDLQAIIDIPRRKTEIWERFYRIERAHFFEPSRERDKMNSFLSDSSSRAPRKVNLASPCTSSFNQQKVTSRLSFIGTLCLTFSTVAIQRLGS